MSVVNKKHINCRIYFLIKIISNGFKSLSKYLKMLPMLSHVYVNVHSLSFKRFRITGNPRQIARVKVPVDVKPFRKYTHLSHTQCIQFTVNTLVGMSDLGSELERFCFALKVGHVTQYHISGIASTLTLSQTLLQFHLTFGWSVSQPASQPAS